MLTVFFGKTLWAGEVESGNKNWINWNTSSIPDIPVRKGVAGAFVGICNDVLIIAGGSYFDKPIWEGGQKKYLDSIFVCVRKGNNYTWKYAGELPYPLAHGAVVSVANGLLCIGGQDNNQKFNNVFLFIGMQINRK